jgi:hypothetical protein
VRPEKLKKQRAKKNKNEELEGLEDETFHLFFLQHLGHLYFLAVRHDASTKLAVSRVRDVEKKSSFHKCVKLDTRCSMTILLIGLSCSMILLHRHSYTVENS